MQGRAPGNVRNRDRDEVTAVLTVELKTHPGSRDGDPGTRRKIRSSLAVALSISLVACGGGGGGDAVVVGADPAPLPAPAPSAPSPTPAPAPTPQPSPGPGPQPTPSPTPVGSAPALPTVGPDGSVQWATIHLPGPADLTLTIEPFASVPVGDDGQPSRLNVMAHVGGRLYVGVERSGRLYRIEEGQAAALWFDLAAALPRHGRRLNANTRTGHSGLRSIAFHPDFASNGRVYMSAMLDRPASPDGLHYLSGAGSPIEADSVLMEWTANPASMQIDPGSFRELFRVGIDVYDHPIKQIAFGPDRLLYVAHGDGSEPTAAGGGGQHLTNALGKILRIDPLASGAGPYAIPVDNPFAGRTDALAEIWSYGHRNPHHLAFLPGGQLVVAEPGHDNIDEINLVERGGHHGWSAREGTYVHLPTGGRADGIQALPADDAARGYVYPAVQYGHPGRRGQVAGGLALGGGYAVNNGSLLSGRYFYCEFATSGQVFHTPFGELTATVRRGEPAALTQAAIHGTRLLFDHDGNPATPAVARASMVEIVNDRPGPVAGDRADIRFGQGPDGTLYLMSKRNGRVYRIAESRPGSGT